jgi:hypothetical protein
MTVALRSEQLTKRFGRQKGTVELRTGTQRVTDPQAVEEMIAAATGIAAVSMAATSHARAGT